MYNDLILFFAELIHENAEDKIEIIKKLQLENKEKLLNEISRILLEYDIVDSNISLTLIERKKLYSKLTNLIDSAINSELEFEKSTLGDILKETGINKYNTNSYVYSLGVKYDLLPVTEKELEKIINNKINGKSWSNRIYDNKNLVAKDLKVTVNKFLKGEINTNDIGDIIKAKYKINSYNADRLIRTEVTRVQAQMSELWAVKHDIKYQLFMATLDYKTSEKCRGYDGKVFKTGDPSKPVPPLHPNCRSDLISIPNEDWKPKERLNNITKENITWQTYEEWKDKNL